MFEDRVRDAVLDDGQDVLLVLGHRLGVVLLPLPLKAPEPLQLLVQLLLRLLPLRLRQLQRLLVDRVGSLQVARHHHQLAQRVLPLQRPTPVARTEAPQHATAPTQKNLEKKTHEPHTSQTLL